jgi:hypothetical protein
MDFDTAQAGEFDPIALPKKVKGNKTTERPTSGPDFASPKLQRRHRRPVHRWEKREVEFAHFTLSRWQKTGTLANSTDPKTATGPSSSITIS